MLHALLLECRSGSLRADSYLCAALGARKRERRVGGRQREDEEEGSCSTRAAHTPLRYSPVRILEILQRVNTAARANSSALCASPSGRSLLFSLVFSLLSNYICLYPLLPSCRRLAILFYEFAGFSSGFFSPSSLSSRLHAKANTTLIYLPGLSGDARVIYCNLIAFNSSGVTVNHRASRIARVRNACCRYDVITSILASPRGCEDAMIAVPCAVLVNE